MVVSTGMLIVSQLALFFGGDFCELGLSSRLRLLFLPEEALGFNCSFMLICLVAPVVFNLFALDKLLSVDFLSPSNSPSASFLLLLRFSLLSKLRLLSCDILLIMLSYLLDCYYLSSGCFHLFPHIRFHKSELMLPSYIITHLRLSSSVTSNYFLEIQYFCTPHCSFFYWYLVHILSILYTWFLMDFNPLIREHLKTRPSCMQAI